MYIISASLKVLEIRSFETLLEGVMWSRKYLGVQMARRGSWDSLGSASHLAADADAGSSAGSMGVARVNTQRLGRQSENTWSWQVWSINIRLRGIFKAERSLVTARWY